MTSRRADDASNDPLRDPRFDAAWRKLSREEPAPALDAAIRAAAHREADGGPRSATRVPSALRPQRWWWPLAAAATIGAIVVGILQLAAPEHVAPTAEQTAVSDMAAASRGAPRDAAAENKSIGETPKALPTPPSTAVPRKQAPARQSDERVAKPPTPVPAPPPVPKSVEEPSARREAKVAAPALLAEPFPADTAGGTSVEPPAASPATAHPSEGAALSKREAEAPRTASRSLDRTQSAQSTVAQNAATPVGPRAKDRSPLPVPDWIALIRKLRDEGRSDEAAKELSAFRAAHPDHEQLLPTDLRAWRPPP